MSIVDHGNWDLSEKGKKDAARHRSKIEDSIKKNIKDVIAEESIITSKNGKKVKIPVKGLKDYRFKFGKNKKSQSGGAGSGKGKPGDVIGRKGKGEGKGKGKAGNEKGDDYLETEVDIDYLIDIMLEDLGLPYIEEKTKSTQLVPKGWKFNSISKTGIHTRVHKKRTLKEAIMRTAMFVGEIVDDTGCADDDAYKALSQAKGDLELAIEIIKRNEIDQSINPDDAYMVFIEDDDLRFKQIEEDVEIHSNAVVIAMMDTSASMDSQKKYLARSMLFWMVEFLKKQYEHVEIRFIAHTTEAKIVDEETFFHKGESGGTYCYTAFEKANYLIDTEYPVEEWNVYCMYVSDGEDFEPDKTMRYVKKTLDKNINMLGYCEIKDQSGYEWGSLLLEHFIETFNFDISEYHDNMEFHKNTKKHLLACVLRDKKSIFPALRHFLFEKN